MSSTPSPFYDFIPPVYRAQCMNVVDGDTIDAFLDLGFHQYARLRVRLMGIDTPEMHSKNATERKKANEAKEWMRTLLRPMQVQDTVILSAWLLKIQTYKDPDNFGRWLGDIWVKDFETKEEIHVNAKLIELGLAKPYKGGKKPDVEPDPPPSAA